MSVNSYLHQNKLVCSWSIQSIRFVFFYKWIINIFLKYECVYLFVWLSSLFTLSIRQKMHRALRSKWCSTVVLLSTFQMASMENEKKWRHTFEKKRRKWFIECDQINLKQFVLMFHITRILFGNKTFATVFNGSDTWYTEYVPILKCLPLQTDSPFYN